MTEEIELPEAVDRAIDECIRENVLRDFLMEHRAEARAMSIFEYDQERHMQQEREAGIEKGKEQLLRRQVQKNLARGMSISEIAEVLDETEKRIRGNRKNRGAGIFLPVPYSFGTISIFRSVFPVIPGTCP